MSHLSPALYATLADIVPDLHVHCSEPWCVIGSTAALLLGAPVSPTDVDIFTSRADADQLITQWSSRHDRAFVPADDARFRSRFARFRFPGAPVDLMGALERHVDDHWEVVQPGRLILVGVNGLAVPVPCLDDQIRLLESFGREKDRHRAIALRALAAQAPRLPVVPPIA